MKTIIATAILCFLIPSAGIMAFNYWQDPFRYYQPITDSKYSKNARWQNAGLVRNADYDTVIIGTSRFENFKPSMFTDAGWQVLKATAPGSMANEQLTTLELVLRTGKAKRVIIEMSHISYTAISPRSPAAFPDFLYHESFETPFRYLLSYDLLLNSITGQEREHIPLEDLHVWWPDAKRKFTQSHLLRTISSTCAAVGKSKLGHSDVENQLDRLSKVIRSASNVEFTMLFTPLSAYTLVSRVPNERELEPLMDRLNFRSRVADIAASNPNTKLYDYASIEEIVLDDGRYKDTGHFDIHMNVAMAQDIIAGDGPLADLTDVNARLLQVRRKALQRGHPCYEQSHEQSHEQSYEQTAESARPSARAKALNASTSAL